MAMTCDEVGLEVGAGESRSATDGKSSSGDGDRCFRGRDLRGCAEGGVKSRRLFIGGKSGDDGIVGSGESFLWGDGRLESLT